MRRQLMIHHDSHGSSDRRSWSSGWNDAIRTLFLIPFAFCSVLGLVLLAGCANKEVPVDKAPIPPPTEEPIGSGYSPADSSEESEEAIPSLKVDFD